MKIKRYLATWLSNTSVAAFIVGGFQPTLDTSLRLLALALSITAFTFGLWLTKKGD